MSIEELGKRLKTNKPDGVYAFYGDEDYTKDFYLRKIKSIVLKTPAPDFNLAEFDGEELDINVLSDAIDTPPYMSPFKLITVSNLTFGDKNMLESLYSVIETCPDGVVLIFVFRAGVIDSYQYSRKKDKLPYAPFLDFIAAHGMNVSFDKVTGAKLFSWIEKHFDAQKVPVTREAVEFMTEYCGNDMTVLSGEIAKLCSYYSGKTIDVGDVKFVCCANAEYQTFDLADAVTALDAGKVKRVMDNLTFSRIAPELILGTVTKAFCDMIYVKAAFSEGKDAAAVKAVSGMPDWMYRRIIVSVRKVTGEWLKNAVNVCAEADKKLKSFAVEPYTMLELAFYGIMSYGKDKS